jgi:hypothetical protein
MLYYIDSTDMQLQVSARYVVFLRLFKHKKIIKVTVQQSLYWSGQTQRVPGV